MKPIPRAPEDRDLNAGTALALAVLGAVMLTCVYLADGHLDALPALLGKSFLVAGGLIFVISRPRPNRRQKVR